MYCIINYIGQLSDDISLNVLYNCRKIWTVFFEKSPLLHGQDYADSLINLSDFSNDIFQHESSLKFAIAALDIYLYLYKNDKELWIDDLQGLLFKIINLSKTYNRDYSFYEEKLSNL